MIQTEDGTQLPAPPATAAPSRLFVAVTQELANLDYQMRPGDHPGRSVWVPEDGRGNPGDRLRILLDTTAPARAVLTMEPDDASPWELTFSATTPPRIQILMLYTALNGYDPITGGSTADSIASVIESAAGFLGISPWPEMAGDDPTR